MVAFHMKDLLYITWNMSQRKELFTRAQMFLDFHFIKDIYKGLSFAKVKNGLVQIRDSGCKASQRSQMV